MSVNLENSLSNDDIIKIGIGVLETEAMALKVMAQELSDDFVNAVNLILNCKGRVILSGMGKSGHIGRKIAATLASTGTPSFFVHPAEASHGDLGMITKQDICIVLSNSGETSELTDIVAHTKRFGIPLIGIASKKNSTLIKSSLVGLILPDVKEACSIGMAPTTSTTASLALGDALAVAVMEMRGFKKENFKTFHPGGKLGAALLRVASLMHTGDALPLISPQTSMKEAILVMSAKTFGVLGIVNENGKLEGIITDGDLRRNLENLLEKTAGEVANKTPKSISAESMAVEALGIMNENKVSCMFVVNEENKPIGLIRIHDCLRAGVV